MADAMRDADALDLCADCGAEGSWTGECPSCAHVPADSGELAAELLGAICDAMGKAARDHAIMGPTWEPWPIYRNDAAGVAILEAMSRRDEWGKP